MMAEDDVGKDERGWREMAETVELQIWLQQQTTTATADADGNSGQQRRCTMMAGYDNGGG